MRAVGLDIGEKYIGVAVSDPLGVIARPYRTIVRTSLAKDLELLRAVIAERDAEVLVVGLPRNMNGTAGPQALKVARLIESLKKLRLPIHKVDERLSSREAEQRMIEAGLEQRERSRRRDEFAAAVILQRYFEEGSI